MAKKIAFGLIVLAGLFACAFEVGRGVRESDEFEKARDERIARLEGRLERVNRRVIPAPGDGATIAPGETVIFTKETP